MKIQSNYPQLLGLVKEAGVLRQQSPLLSILLKDKLERLHSNNAIRIQEGHRKLTELMDKHIVKEDGNYKVVDNKFVFNSEEDEAAYKEGYENFGKLTFQIEI